ncbi:MAG TPA: alcohol dehydrogenase catalytic domain-containing protein [bacterium]|nr:alcohol dehydrogenase catalytic domain-containing protein [bacterium]
MALTLPAVTRTAVYHGPGDIRIERVPIPAPGPGEILARIRACGLCSSETMSWYMQRKAPVPLGHEPVGEVVVAGGGVSRRPGERVFIHHHAPCHTCRACRRGDFVHCQTWRRTRLVPGGLAEYALVPAPVVAADLLALPPEVDDETAVFVEPLACALKALRRARLRPDDRVAVIGLGVIGLLQVLLLRAHGAERVIGVDPLPERRAAGLEAGAQVVGGAGVDVTTLVRESTDGGADLVIVTPPSLEALRLGFDCVAPGGRLVVFTPLPPEESWPLPVHDLFFREVTVIPSYSAGPDDTREALAQLSAGLPVRNLITHRLRLDEAAEGYRLIAAGRALKVVVHP